MLTTADEIASIITRGNATFDDDIVLRRAIERRLRGFTATGPDLKYDSGRPP